MLGMARSLHNRITALPVGVGVDSADMEGKLVIDGDTIVFATQGVPPFVTTVLKINDNEAETYYKGTRITAEN